MHDYDNNRYICKEKTIELTFKENELLKILIENKGKIVHTDKLILFLFPKSLSGRALNQLVHRLRKKLKDEITIRTRPGFGYRI